MAGDWWRFVYDILPPPPSFNSCLKKLSNHCHSGTKETPAIRKASFSNDLAEIRGQYERGCSRMRPHASTWRELTFQYGGWQNEIALKLFLSVRCWPMSKVFRQRSGYWLLQGRWPGHCLGEIGQWASNSLRKPMSVCAWQRGFGKCLNIRMRSYFMYD